MNDKHAENHAKDNGNDSAISRRGFLSIGSAALATVAGTLAVNGAMAQDRQQNAGGQSDRSKSDPGLANRPLDAQNPDSEWLPDTDSRRLVRNFKYLFSFANKRTYEGGWSREVTVRELPVSKAMAGVNMRLTAGGVRELHWHTANEWAIVLAGNARITAIDADGKSFVADTKKYDLWYFPSGIPHSIQGLDPDGTEFMLVFDDGDFSESGTALLSDSMAHVPRDVLSKNFGIAEPVWTNLPRRDLFIFQTAVLGPLEADQKAAAGTLGKSTQDFAFRTMEMLPTSRTPGIQIWYSRNVQEQLLSGPVIVRVAGAHTSRTGDDPPQYRQGDIRCDPEREDGCRATLV